MVELLKDHGLLVRADSRTRAEASADEWLAARGVELEDEPSAQRAWWDGAGFVQEGHAGSEPVFVVNLPLPVLAQLT